MDIKCVMPYTKIWFDCKGNLYLSILQTLDDKYQYIACNNEYHYDNKVVPTDNCEFTMLEMYTTWSIIGDMMKNVTYVDYENDEQFFDRVVELLDEGKYFFAGVDLYYWIEENFCHGTDHWLHSALIQKYDAVNEIFYVFDVDNDKTYGIFTIGKKEFLKAVKEGFARNEVSFFCDIDTGVGIENITLKILINNAKRIINNLNETLTSDYFWMTPQDYFERSYADLIHVFLGRIAQRHIANALMIDELYKRGYFNKEIRDKLYDIAVNLSKGWALVQCKVNMLFLQKNLDRKIKNVNIKLKELFNLEIEMWTEFCRRLEDKNEDEIVFKFD